MTDLPHQSRIPVLDPAERVFEILFALIMVLGFTGGISVAESGREDIRTMLLGALGCNFAWGVIDGVMFLMARLAEKGRALKMFQRLRSASDSAEAHRLIREALPPLIGPLMRPEELESLSQRLRELPAPPDQARLTPADGLGGLSVMLLVFLSTFPVVIPFLAMKNAVPALRVSNGIAILMLFLVGNAYGRYAGRSPVLVGVMMVVLGVSLAALTMALGG